MRVAAVPPARRLSLSHQVPTFESRFSRLARPSRQAYEKVVERDDTGSCDRQPQEQGKILELIESEQSLQRVNVGPFGGANGYNHGDTQGPGGYTSKQSQQQEQTPKEFDSGSERREEVRERNSPANEILGNLRQVVELAPAAPKKYPTHSNTRKQWRQPREMCSNLLGPNNQPIDQPPHTISPSHGVRRATCAPELFDSNVKTIVSAIHEHYGMIECVQRTYGRWRSLNCAAARPPLHLRRPRHAAGLCQHLHPIPHRRPRMLASP